MLALGIRYQGLASNNSNKDRVSFTEKKGQVKDDKTKTVYLIGETQKSFNRVGKN